MESLLEKHEFKQGNLPNEWFKEEWVVRFYGSEVEAFNNVEDDVMGKYCKEEATLENLEIILEDIKNF